MTSEKTMDHLPDEVMVEIFTYLSVEDLVLSAQHVSQRWKELSQDARLWRNLVYAPYPEKPFSEVIELLQQMPRLKSFVYHRHSSDNVRITSVLTEYCKEITTITWNRLGLTAEILKQMLIHLPEIECLHIHPSVLEDIESFELLGKFPKLTKLKCTWVEDSPSFMYFEEYKDFVGYKTLQELEIVSLAHFVNHVTKLLIEGSVDHLLTLNLQGVTDNVLTIIPSCYNLETLCLNFLSRVNTEFSRTLPQLGKLLHLKSLTLRLFVDSNKDVLCSLFSDDSLPNLVELDLSHCMNFSHRVAQSIGRCCNRLQVLRLRACSGLDDKCLENLARCRELRTLDISGCSSVTEQGLSHIGQCGQLRSLDLSWLGSVSRFMLEALHTALNLQKLWLDHNQVYQPDIVALVSHLPKLAFISVYRCPELNLPSLQNTLTRCRIVDQKPAAQTHHHLTAGYPESYPVRKYLGSGLGLRRFAPRSFIQIEAGDVIEIGREEEDEDDDFGDYVGGSHDDDSYSSDDEEDNLRT